MRHVHARALVVVALAIQLGGCNSFLGIKSVRNSSDSPSDLAVSVSATDSGRSFLAAGSTGSAIEAFQRALALGEPPAPALNGMGVAYARLGRPDLAERFFLQAIEAAPAEPRYAANLARLIDTATNADNRRFASAANKSPAAPIASAPIAEPVPVQGRLQRLSRGEVRIATATPQTAPVRASASQPGKQFKPVIRISFADVEQRRPQSFIRIQLPEAKPMAASEAEPKSTALP